MLDTVAPMTGTVLDRPAVRTESGSPWWNMVGAASVGLAVLAVVTRTFYDPEVRLTDGVRLPAAATVVVIAAVGVLAAVLGRRRAAAGYALVAVASAALGGAWLMLTGHRFAGPVLVNLSADHGIHVADTLAVVPFAFAVVATAAAIRSVRGAPRRAR